MVYDFSETKCYSHRENQVGKWYFTELTKGQ